MMASAEAESSRTNWSMIFDAARAGKGSDAAREQLLRRYWPAVYAYIRRSGRDVHEASDLTQGFICDVVLQHELFSKADPKRGRFRSLLLQSLKNYLRGEHRRQSTAKRKSDTPMRAWNETDADARSTGRSQSPEAAFSTQWTVTLLQQVLTTVKQQCVKESMASHWEVFESRIVRPMLTGGQPTPYAALVRQLGLKDAAQAANMMVSVKRRFAQALYHEVGQTVSDPLQTDEELHELMRDLER